MKLGDARNRAGYRACGLEAELEPPPGIQKWADPHL